MTGLRETFKQCIIIIGILFIEDFCMKILSADLYYIVLLMGVVPGVVRLLIG